MALTTASGRPIYRVRAGHYTTDYDPYAGRGDIIERAYNGKDWLVWHRPHQADHTKPTPRFRTLAEAAQSLP